MQSFGHFGHLDTNKLEEMWNILLFEDADDNSQDIDRDNLSGLIDMLYEEMGSKDIQKQPPQSKIYASSDVLDILQTVYQDCFKTAPNFEVKMGEIERGMILFK